MLTIAKRKYGDPSHVTLVKNALISIPNFADKIRISALLKVKLNVCFKFYLISIEFYHKIDD